MSRIRTQQSLRTTSFTPKLRLHAHPLSRLQLLLYRHLSHTHELRDSRLAPSYRGMVKNNTVMLEQKYVLDLLSEPLLKLYQVRDSQLRSRIRTHVTAPHTALVH